MEDKMTAGAFGHARNYGGDSLFKIEPWVQFSACCIVISSQYN